MSCHDIGAGVNFIIEKVLEMYDDGKISKEATMEMLRVFPDAVNWCDGNTDEAQETLTVTHCAKCLKKYSTKEKVVYLDKVDTVVTDEDILNDLDIWDNWYEIMNRDKFNGRSLCRDCFEKSFADVLTEAGMKKILKSARR